MTKEQLQERINKKQNQIAKMEKNLVKYVVDDEFTAMCNRYFESGDIIELKNYKKVHNLMWLPEYYSKASDLNDARITLKKYELELQKLINYENEEKIEVIWNFLQNWKSLVYRWTLNNAGKYFDLKKNEQSEYIKYLNDKYNVDNEKALDWHQRMNAEHFFKKYYYSDIHSLTQRVTKIIYKYNYNDDSYTFEGYEVNEEELNKILDKDVKNKYDKLINEITHITGEITDAEGLTIADNGEINGTVTGKNGIAVVNTFSAGGWNIQCFHYRTKIYELRIEK